MSPCAAPISTMPKYILEIQHWNNLCQNTGDEPEVENGEYLTLGEGEHHDASKLSQCDPAGKYPMIKSSAERIKNSQNT